MALDMSGETVSIAVFGHDFQHVDPELAQELVTLEKEGAIYSTFWEDTAKTFRYYRIRFLPSEIFEFVEAALAQQEFEAAIRSGSSFDRALEAITDSNIANRVRSYGDYGHTLQADGSVVDIRGCPASFLTADLERLLTGQTPHRYEPLPDLGDSRGQVGLVSGIINAFPVMARHLEQRKRNRPPYVIENEYDVQDLLYAAIRAVFLDAVEEEWTPQIAGTSRRVDIVIPSIDTFVETKIVRDERHASQIAGELMIDFECYHTHPRCNHLIVLVYDPLRYLDDPEQLAHDLSGLRQKGGHSFDVDVMVR